MPAGTEVDPAGAGIVAAAFLGSSEVRATKIAIAAVTAVAVLVNVLCVAGAAFASGRTQSFAICALDENATAAGVHAC